jgi:hypothetical protein
MNTFYEHHHLGVSPRAASQPSGSDHQSLETSANSVACSSTRGTMRWEQSCPVVLSFRRETERPRLCARTKNNVKGVSMATPEKRNERRWPSSARGRSTPADLPCHRRKKRLRIMELSVGEHVRHIRQILDVG